MEYDASILEHCDPAFVESWQHLDVARPLFAGFIDAVALIACEADSMIRVALPGPGFIELFGPDCMSDVSNVLLIADRQDRDELVRGCTTSLSAREGVHVNVAWSAGSGKYSGSEDNFFKTIVSIDHVGSTDNAELLYFAFRDVSAIRTAEHSLARSQFSTALRALFDEIFMLNLETGKSEPVYAGGKPLANEDGTPIACGFHAMYTTVHRDDIKLFWKYSNYTFVENQLFGESPEDAITFDLRRYNEGSEDEYHWERVFISRVASADKRKVVLVCSQNIDEQKDAQRRERELRSKAQIDTLCGLYNHGTSEELMRARLQGLGAEDAAVFAIFDVDDFKRVNDTYGHSMGDKLLQTVAGAVKGVCRDEDIAGRMGGDEFVALFCCSQPVDQESLRIRMNRCAQRVREESAALGIDPPITLSIGVVAATVDDNAYNEIFDRADRLLYEAKKSGKDAVHFA